MPDTLVDPPEPLRPTVTEDPAVAAGPPPTVPGPEPEPAPRPRRVSRKGCWVAALIALAALLAAGAAAFYFFFWLYEPTAHRHIPGNANLVFRLEAADVALFGPVRKHLWPLLEERTSGKGRDARLAEATGVNPATDLREIVVASSDVTSWIVVVGGRIPPGRFVKGLEKVAREEGWVGWRRDGELFVGPGGLAIAQAEDATILVGTDAAVVRAALPASEDHQRLALPKEGAVTFAITREAWGGAGGAIGGLLPRGGVGLFRRMNEASGAFSLGKAPVVTMRIEPVAGETAAALAGDVETVLGDLRLVTLLLPDLFGEKQALQSARVTATDRAVELRADWPYEGLDRACEKLAQLLRARGSAAGQPAPSGGPPATK